MAASNARQLVALGYFKNAFCAVVRVFFAFVMVVYFRLVDCVNYWPGVAPGRSGLIIPSLSIFGGGVLFGGDFAIKITGFYRRAA